MKQYPFYSNSENESARKYIFTALILLLRRKKLHAIPIKELCDKAGVSRTSYYRNYSSKEDILAQYINSEFQARLQRLFRENHDSFFENSAIFFAIARKHRELLDIIIKNDLSRLLLAQYRTHLYTLVKMGILRCENGCSDYYVSFWAGGLTELVLSWTRRDMRDSNQEMATYLDRLIVGLSSSS
jgi:AcrR family transcriptional regulator